MAKEHQCHYHHFTRFPFILIFLSVGVRTMCKMIDFCNISVQGAWPMCSSIWDSWQQDPHICALNKKCSFSSLFSDPGAVEAICSRRETLKLCGAGTNIEMDFCYNSVENFEGKKKKMFFEASLEQKEFFEWPERQRFWITKRAVLWRKGYMFRWQMESNNWEIKTIFTKLGSLY